jgi:hypothetical protein
MKRNTLIAIALAAIVIGAFTYPMWAPQANQLLSGLFGGLPTGGPAGGQVKLSVGLIDADDDSAVSPAGISVIFYEWNYALYGANIPRYNIAPLQQVGAGTETPDGEFTTSATAAEGSWVYIYATDSGNTFQTTYSIQQVPYVLQQGIDREAILDPILMNPRTATSADDVSIMITSAGAEVDNSSNWAFGSNDIKVELAASSGNAWGNRGYIDPATGYFFLGGLVIFEYDLSTARVTHTGGPLYDVIEYGTTRYYVYEISGPILNDQHISGDGTWSMTTTYDCTVGGTNVSDVYFIPYRRADQVESASFGTKDWQSADAMEDIDFDTS